jgi:endonuclease/exonuclease/phosphatase family metal-dependent hydrolase
MTANATPARTRLRLWCVGLLTVGAVVGGGALAFAGTSAAKTTNNQTGQTGASPVPVTDVVHGKTKFRVASFNILGYDHTEAGGQKTGYADGAQRMKWAVQVLKRQDVDVVGLQEFQPQQYAKWMKKATNTYDIWPGYLDTDGFLRNSIAWRKDMFRLVSSTWVKLPYFKGDVLRMPVVLLQNIKTGQQFYVMNFQNPADVRGNASKWRLQGQRVQIALVNQLRASNNLPIIWTGDMNAKQQVFCRVTAQAGMVAASGGYRDATTCQPPSGMVVDWIFGSGVTFKKYEQIRDKKIARTTDHHLVTSKVRILPQGATIPPGPSPTTTCTTQTPTATPYVTNNPSATTTITTTLPPSPAVPTATTTATVPPGSPYTVTPTPSPTQVCTTTTPAPVIFPTAP